jgi:hypothetical protein
MKISNPIQKLLFTLIYIAIIATLYFTGVGCVFRACFGIICPGCGMTRAVISLLRLDFIGAINHHPMVFSLPILYLYFLIDGGLFKSKLLNTIFLSLIGFGFLVVWLVKIL